MNKKPNILFYFSDQQRADTVCEEVTPRLWQLAKEGVLFENTFTCQPVCGPARACIQTGQYASTNGCFANAIPLDTQAQTIAKILKGQGYQTGYVGKWHLASGMMPSHQHFETKPVPEQYRGGYEFWRAADVLEFTSNGSGGYVYDENDKKCQFEGVRSTCLTDFALQFINENDTNKPFFLFLSHIEPHHQNSTDKFECPSSYAEKFSEYPIPQDLANMKDVYKRAYKDYLGCCNALDENLGRLIDLLVKKGIYDDTIIIYTSDHGCHFRTRNLEYKRSCHDNSIKIPLVVRGGKFLGGANRDEMVSLIDLPATVVDIATGIVPSSFEGESLINLMDNKQWKDNVFYQISESHLGRGIRTKNYKYAVKGKGVGLFRAGSSKYKEAFLYDLAIDPNEQNNLVCDPKYAEVRKKLKAKLIKNMVKINEPLPKIKSKGKLLAKIYKKSID